jgi:hypothetical protein
MFTSVSQCGPARIWRRLMMLFSEPVWHERRYLERQPWLALVLPRWKHLSGIYHMCLADLQVLSSESVVWRPPIMLIDLIDWIMDRERGRTKVTAHCEGFRTSCCWTKRIKGAAEVTYLSGSRDVFETFFLSFLPASEGFHLRKHLAILWSSRDLSCIKHSTLCL